MRRPPDWARPVWVAVACIGLASITLGSGRAAAQPVDGEGDAEAAEAGDREAEARSLFEQGIAYRDQERWGEALEYFRRSWAQVERPSTAFNLAVVLLRLARPSETLRALDDYLRLSDPEAEAERREEARRLLELALGSIARVTLTLDPTSAIVRVDGQPVGGGGAVRELTLDPGTHSARVEAEGYEPQTLEIAVLDGEVTRRAVTLVRRPRPTGPARLRITASVATATIHLDGEVVGQGTWLGEVEPGRHRVEVRDEGFVPFRRTLEAEAGEQLEVQAALSRREEEGLLDSSLFWIVAGAVVVAAGVGLGVALASGTEDPYGGTTGVVLLGLRGD